ncbi:hypothetical protein [Tenacibaculum maritimum]|uniref:hypothetical protein n=1 Tax=Tenacibaculum maritimum TaxID=107401 RepID=UPI001331051C|nr:hypothetical protein [Tenacibaculum maritimum]
MQKNGISKMDGIVFSFGIGVLWKSYPFNLLISGGWNNIVAGVFFLLSTLILIRFMKDTDKKQALSKKNAIK